MKKTSYQLINQLILIILMGITLPAFGQAYSDEIVHLGYDQVALGGTVNLSKAAKNDDWGAFMKNFIVYHPKLKGQQTAEESRQDIPPFYRPKPSNKVQKPAPPVVGTQFQGNFGTGGVPNDNHMAISDSGIIVSVMNSNLYVFDDNGQILDNVSLGGFVSGVPGANNNSKYDPRVTYDQLHDRFIVVFLNGTNSGSSQVLVCFSQTNDPTGNWNVYPINGSVAAGEWSDYPRIGISTDDLFVCTNMGQDGQQGIVAGGFFQFDLADGYAGNSLTMTSYRTGFPSITPVEGALAPYGPKFYLIRTENGSGNSVWIYEMSDALKNGGTLSTGANVPSNLSITMPPLGQQKGSSKTLDTGDNRLQDCYFENGRIEFVTNTAVAGRSAIYHGTTIVSPLGLNFSQTSGEVITSSTLDLVYPSIAYGGIQGSGGFNASYIGFLHTSPSTYPGNGAVYIDEYGEVSPMANLKAGAGPIDSWGSLLRWGDYTATDERRNKPGEVWCVGSEANPWGGTSTFITQLLTPGILDKAPELESGVEMKVYPNPASEYLALEFEVDVLGEYSLEIIDINGKQVQQLITDQLRPGVAKASFKLETLSEGIYFARISQNGRVVYQKKFIKH